MATKATFDIKAIRTEATKGLHAGVGAADLAYETVKESVKEYVAEAQKRLEAVQKDAQKAFASAQKSVRGFELEPKALRDQGFAPVELSVAVRNTRALNLYEQMGFERLGATHCWLRPARPQPA